jgi:curved DNA-binding protein CbpA
MDFISKALSMVSEKQTAVLEVLSGKKKWLFYFMSGELAQTKSNLKPEQTSVLQEKFPDLDSDALLRLQTTMRIERALEAETINIKKAISDKHHQFNLLDLLLETLHKTLSDEDIEQKSIILLDAKATYDDSLVFSKKDVQQFLSALKGTLRCSTLVASSGLESNKAWIVLWIANELGALELSIEKKEDINDLLDFNLDELLEEEVGKEDVYIEEEVPEGEDAVQKIEMDDVLKVQVENIDELANHIQQAENHFAILGVPHTAEPDEFRQAFLDLSKKLHPDKFVGADDGTRLRATELFDQVREAYEVLSNEEKRKKYIDEVILGNKSDEDEAIEHLQAYWKAEAAFNKGKTLFHQGQLPMAHANFKEAYESSPETLEFAAYYGYTLFNINRLSHVDTSEEGLTLLQEVLNKNKEQEVKLDSAWVLMGRAYREKGDTQKARRTLKKALQFNPSNQDAVREMRRLTGQAGGKDKGKGKGKGKKDDTKSGFWSKIFGGKK